MNSFPMVNAWASPSGLGWTLKSKVTPNLLPSPSSSRYSGKASGEEMTRISRIPASISTEMG